MQKSPFFDPFLGVFDTFPQNWCISPNLGRIADPQFTYFLRSNDSKSGQISDSQNGPVWPQIGPFSGNSGFKIVFYLHFYLYTRFFNHFLLISNHAEKPQNPVFLTSFDQILSNMTPFYPKSLKTIQLFKAFYPHFTLICQ